MVANELARTLRRGGAELTLPVWVLPGLAEEAVVASLGFGRRVVGTVGTGGLPWVFGGVGAPAAVLVDWPMTACCRPKI